MQNLKLALSDHVGPCFSWLDLLESFSLCRVAPTNTRKTLAPGLKRRGSGAGGASGSRHGACMAHTMASTCHCPDTNGVGSAWESPL